MLRHFIFGVVFSFSSALKPLNYLENIHGDLINLPTLDGAVKAYNRSELELSLADDDYDPYNEMKFHLYTRRNPNQEQEIEIDHAESLAASNFNPIVPTRIIVHGWQQTVYDDSVILPKDAYLQLGENNCIGVDWTAGSNTSNFLLAAERIGDSGRVIARFIDFLIRETSTTISQFTVIGHSLGGQLVGHVGKNMREGVIIPAIVSLDPAALSFSVDDPDKRLNDGDADYVEVIHTNKGELGFSQPIGTADFYPNSGGRAQPGCGLDPSGACSHARSVRYFAESINSIIGFVGQPCVNYESITKDGCEFTSGPRKILGGEPINVGNKRGIFWLTTNTESPFAQGA